ncbi:hypothetical protein SO802_007963, partial [Lithocarpus litseifolius]
VSYFHGNSKIRRGRISPRNTLSRRSNVLTTISGSAFACLGILYVLRNPQPYCGEWMETVDLTFPSYKALPEELVKSLKEKGSLKKGSIRVDMEELDLEEIDYEGLKQKISLVLKERMITMKDLKEQRALQLRLEQLFH